MSKFNPDKLLVELSERLRSGGKRKAALAESVSAIWEYLVKTPGEQRPYDEYAKMLDVGRNTAFAKLKTLVNNGVIKKTAGRTGLGVGFICEWLEAHRRGEIAPLDPSEIAATHDVSHVDVKGSLSDIDVMAERGVQSARQLMEHDPRLGLSMIEAFREIQLRVSKTMILVVDK